MAGRGRSSPFPFLAMLAIIYLYLTTSPFLIIYSVSYFKSLDNDHHRLYDEIN
jgi:hypothetical protein